MDFVKNGTIGILGEKATEVGAGKFTPIQVFEVDMVFVGHQVANKCCLARLSGAGDGNDRIPLAELVQGLLSVSFNVHRSG